MRAVTDMRIAIVGAGPVGLCMAILLHDKGVPVQVFEKEEELCQLPAAHVVNTRTSEILREIDLFETVAAAAAPPERTGFVTWSQSLAGRRFGRLAYQGDAAQKRARELASPARTLNIGQDKLELLLYEKLCAVGGEVRFSHRVTHARIDGNDAVLEIATGDGASETARFDYVIACDGASSTVRRAIGIEMEGPPSIARFASAYFEADLDPYLGADLGPVNFIAGPDVRGVIIGFDLKKTWAFMCVMPEESTPADYSGEVMLELIRRAIGDPAAVVKVTSIGAWNMSAQVATAFRSGPFLLAGDAAHRFPPTGGLGLNTGIGDAHNLAWRMALVARGEASPNFLNNYEQERRPIASRNRDHSLENAMKMAEVDAAIGAATLAPTDAAVARAVWTPTYSHPTVGTDADSKQVPDEIAQRIADQRPHFDSLALEIGYRYGPEGTRQIAHAEEYVPVVAPGARLPHIWLWEENGALISSLDLSDRIYPTLLVGRDAERWRAEIARWDVPLTVRDVSALVPVESTTSSDLLLKAFGGIILLRPDAHVAWQSFLLASAAAFAEVQQAIYALVPGRGGARGICSG